jgi:predicted TIM-barrel fold metal-dependent hydrolase
MSIDTSVNQARPEVSSDRYMIVSTDSHVGPLVREQLRDYCPKKFLGDFDDFLADWEPRRQGSWVDGSPRAGGDKAIPFTDKVKNRTAQTTDTDGVHDPGVRLADMDMDGVAAEMIFHGAMTPDVIPWQGDGRLDLEAVGLSIYNRWLADFCSAAPQRLLGAVQLPLWDIDASVKEVEWARDAGLACINFPAPNRELLAYNHPDYEPFWAAVEASGLPLTTHGGSGDMPPYEGPEAWALYTSDLFFYSRRGLWYLTWAGVFERHPALKMMFVEQRADWVPDTLAHLDSIYYSEFQDYRQLIPRPPSDYFHQNCYVASSFMARFEAEKRYAIGLDKLMWGTDYPHYEGTWGFTQESLRSTFSGMPVDEVRMILGENAIPVLNLDRKVLRDIADRIGPDPDVITQPLRPEERPEILGCAFRTMAAWS